MLRCCDSVKKKMDVSTFKWFPAWLHLSLCRNTTCQFLTWKQLFTANFIPVMTSPELWEFRFRHVSPKCCSGRDQSPAGPGLQQHALSCLCNRTCHGRVPLVTRTTRISAAAGGKMEVRPFVSRLLLGFRLDRLEQTLGPKVRPRFRVVDETTLQPRST